MTAKAEHVTGDRWRVRIYFGRDPATDKPLQRAKYFRARNQREANKLAAGAETDLRKELAGVKSSRGTMTELVELWVRHRATDDSPATVYRRQSIIAAIKRDLGKIRVDQLTTLQIDQWYARLREENIGRPGAPVKHRTESTIHHYHRVLHAIMQQAYVWDMTDRTPANKATTPKKRKHARVTSPPVATINLLLAACPPDLQVAAYVLSRTGLRRGELAALRWPDIDLDGGVINVTKSAATIPGRGLIVKAPKNEESVRQVEIDPSTVYVLDQHRRRWQHELPELAADAYLFPAPFSEDRTGRTPRSPDWMSARWRAVCQTAGAKVRLHDLRHAHASILIDLGVPVTAVSARLGHAKTSTTTDIYGHPTDESGRAASLAIEAALS